MRKLIYVAGLVAVLVSPLPKPAGATEVVVPEQELVCEEIFIPAEAEFGIEGIEKTIDIEDIEAGVRVPPVVIAKVVKTIAVQVCAGTEGDVVADVAVGQDLNGAVQCPEGAVGVGALPVITNAASIEGGAINAHVKVAVTDEDVIAGHAFDRLEEELAYEKRIVVPAGSVEDRYAFKARLCVGPVVRR